jgi:hypothetical protein
MGDDLPVDDGRGGIQGETYGNTVVVLLADALSFGLALLEGMLVLKLRTHVGLEEVV